MWAYPDRTTLPADADESEGANAQMEQKNTPSVGNPLREMSPRAFCIRQTPPNFYVALPVHRFINKHELIASRTKTVRLNMKLINGRFCARSSLDIFANSTMRFNDRVFLCSLLLYGSYWSGSGTTGCWHHSGVIWIDFTPFEAAYNPRLYHK